MNPIHVIWLSLRQETPNRKYWDYQFAEDLFDGSMWRPASSYEFTHIEALGNIPVNSDGAIIVLAARHHADIEYLVKLNTDMARLRWVVLFLLGDEENSFPVHLLRHDNIRIYRMMARPDDLHTHRRLPNFYTPHVHLMDGQPCPDKDIDVVFMGQITHSRRVQCIDAIRKLPDRIQRYLVESPGFTQGLPPDEYVAVMAKSKIAPCPSGPVAPDTFRFAEALELGCIPVPDECAPIPYPYGYWVSVLGDSNPFLRVNDWAELPQIVDYELGTWPQSSNLLCAWWMQYKRNLAYALKQDIAMLSGHQPEPQYLDDQVTAVILTSPSPAHPSTEHIERVIKSIRYHFPLCEIIIGCDGVRPEMAEHRAAYEEYLRRIIWNCQRNWANVLPIVFSEHMHQAKMMRIITENDRWVETPLLLVCEHDTPIVTTGEYVNYDGVTIDTQRYIEWPAIFKTVLDGDLNVARLYHRKDMPPEHAWLCRDKVIFNGAQFWKMVQWSNRPHVARTEYYRRILHDHFSLEANCFVEDRLMTFIQNQPWENHRIGIYWPSDAEAMRSWHSEGRCHDGKWFPKLEEKQIF